MNCRGRREEFSTCGWCRGAAMARPRTRRPTLSCAQPPDQRRCRLPRLEFRAGQPPRGWTRRREERDGRARGAIEPAQCVTIFVVFVCAMRRLASVRERTKREDEEREDEGEERGRRERGRRARVERAERTPRSRTTPASREILVSRGSSSCAEVSWVVEILEKM